MRRFEIAESNCWQLDYSALRPTWAWGMQIMQEQLSVPPRPSDSLRSFKIVPDDFVCPWAPLSFRISHSCFGLSLGSEVHPAANTIYLQW
jgi:hypothetical protein